VVITVVYIVDVQAMYSPIPSDNGDDDDEVDDVTGSKHAVSYDVTSGGRDTFVIASVVPEGDGDLAKKSAATFHSGSSEDNSQIEGCVDRSSESVDGDSEIVDPEDDDEDDEDGSVCLTEYTISESLEERDHEALEMERSTGLAQSTGETYEYVDSDPPSGSLTPVNEDLEMTLGTEDGGSPIVQSATIDDDRSAEEPKDCENVLLETNNSEITTKVQEDYDDNCSDEARDLTANESNEDQLCLQSDNPALTTNQLYHQDKSTVDVAGAGSGMEQQDIKRDSYRDGDSKSDEDIGSENDEVHLSTDDREDSSTAHSVDESELEQLDSDDGDDLLDQTVLLEKTSDELAASTKDRRSTSPGHPTEDYQVTEIVKNFDDEDVDEHEEKVSSGEDSDKEKEFSSQQDDGLSSTNPDPFMAEANQRENDGESKSATTTVTLGEVSGVCIPAELELEQPERKQDDADGRDLFGQTVLLTEAPAALVTSSDDQTSTTTDVVAEDNQDSGSLTNHDDEFANDTEKGNSSGEDFDKGGIQDESHNVQQDCKHSSTSPDILVTEQNQDENGSDSVLGDTVKLREVSGECIPSSSSQTLVDISDVERQKVSSYEAEQTALNQSENDGEIAQDDVHRAASEHDEVRSMSQLEDLQDIGEDPLQEKERTFPQVDKPPVSSDDFSVAALTEDRQKEVERRTSDESQDIRQDPANPCTDSDLSTAVPTLDCLQLAVLSKPTVNKTEDQQIGQESRTPDERQDFRKDLGNPYTDSDLSSAALIPDCLQLAVVPKSTVDEEDRQLEIHQGAATSNTWCEDEDKENLLCLLDSRRRTELDRENWQLARHIQDNMTLVKEGELDDLENVQVSVKVSRIFLCFIVLYYFLLRTRQQNNT